MTTFIDGMAPLRTADLAERYLDASFWIERLPEPHTPIMDAESITRFNRRSFDLDPHLVDLATLPEAMEADRLREQILSISKPHAFTLHFDDGRAVGASDYGRLEAMMALPNIPPRAEVRFGLVIRRTDMRTWPSAETAYTNEETIDLDRFQENGLFPGDAVAILHESTDGAWCFVQSYNYAAWARKEHIAVAEREWVIGYGRARPFLVVTGSKVTTNFNPRRSAISELQLDMGVKLPLLQSKPGSPNVDGQNPFTSYAVQLPARDDSGNATLHTALIARSQDVRTGYLEYTPENVIRQGFKFLGERYGWGHSYNSRDCSGLVTEIFRSFGILMPRNTRQQVASPVGLATRFGPDDGREQRLQAVARLRPGDLVYSPGHVMIYVGSHDGRPFVLHDTSSSISFRTGDEEMYEGILNGVSITPLLSLRDEEGRHYLDTMWAIKRITNGTGP